MINTRNRTAKSPRAQNSDTRAGRSNSTRTRAWKTELAALALGTGLEITACQFPPGTSKWNKIEHRLFSHITMNWRGWPLTSHEVIVQAIASTTTRTGLRVRAELDTATYPPGEKSAMSRWHRSPSAAMTGTETGTTPCIPSRAPRHQPRRRGPAAPAGPIRRP